MSAGSCACQSPRISSLTTAINRMAINTRLKPDITKIAPRALDTSAIKRISASVATASSELCINSTSTANTAASALADINPPRNHERRSTTVRNTCIGGVAVALTR